MGYKNKTYVIFDGDEDMWAYAYMKGWKSNENMDFNFYDAHDIRPLTDRASEETVKQALRERMGAAKQVVVIIGENTKNLYKFVKWEIELALKKALPIIAVNLNEKRSCDYDRCPAILLDECVVHIPFKAKIMQHALDHFPDEYARKTILTAGPRYYGDEIYKKLGL